MQAREELSRQEALFLHQVGELRFRKRGADVEKALARQRADSEKETGKVRRGVARSSRANSDGYDADSTRTTSKSSQQPRRESRSRSPKTPSWPRARPADTLQHKPSNSGKNARGRYVYETASREIHQSAGKRASGHAFNTPKTNTRTRLGFSSDSDEDAFEL